MLFRHLRRRDEFFCRRCRHTLLIAALLCSATRFFAIIFAAAFAHTIYAALMAPCLLPAAAATCRCQSYVLLLLIFHYDAFSPQPYYA